MSEPGHVGARERTAWREPMMWLAAALPLAVLVAAAATIAIASTAPADRVVDEVRRIAQVQLTDLAPDRAAAHRGLRGRLEADGVRGEVRIALDDPGAGDASHRSALPEELALSMLHPMDEGQDRHLVLQRDGTAYRGTTSPWKAAQAWTLRAQPRDGTWRLGGRLAANAGRAELVPAVAH